MKNGGPAFPSLSNLKSVSNSDGNVVALMINEEADRICGMSLHDYFAGQALIMIGPSLNPETVAFLAYEYANAMIKCREQYQK